MAQTTQRSRSSQTSGRTSRSGKATTDPAEIQRWAEKHGGHPARVKGTGRGDDPGILRIDFPGFSGEGKLEPIDWDQFFRWFEANNLALVYRDKDRFNKIISRESAQDKQGGRRRQAAARPRARTSRSKQTRTRARRSSGRATQQGKRTTQQGKRTTQQGKRTTRKASSRSSATEKRPRAR
jgi:hypothetical protein